MRFTSSSDLWFGITVIALFAFMGAVLFGSTAGNPSLLLNLLVVVGFSVTFAAMRRPLSSIGRTPRLIAWSAIGFSFGTLFSVAIGGAFDLMTACVLGASLPLVDFVFEKLGWNGDSADG